MEEVSLVMSFFLTASFSTLDFLTRWCNGKLFCTLGMYWASILSISSNTAVRRWAFMLKWSILSWNYSRFTARWFLLWRSKGTSRCSTHVSGLTSVRRSLWYLNHRAVVARVFSNSDLLGKTNRLVGSLFISRIVFMNIWSVNRVSAMLDCWKLASLRWRLLSGTFVRSTINWCLRITPGHHAGRLDFSVNHPRLWSLFLSLTSKSSYGWSYS